MKLFLKHLIHYVVGICSFFNIAFITQRITVAILLKGLIDPIQDWNNILKYISAYGRYYLIVFTILYLFINFATKKYDRYIVKKLNTELEQIKEKKEINYGGELYGKR